MANYGGNDGAGVLGAYKTAGRNVARSVTDAGTSAAGAVGTAAAGTVDRAARGYTAARDIAGMSPLAAGLRGARKAVNPALGRLRGLLAKVRV